MQVMAEYKALSHQRPNIEKATSECELDLGALRVDEVLQVMKRLKEKSVESNLLSSSLEDAFIALGEKSASLDEVYNPGGDFRENMSQERNIELQRLQVDRENDKEFNSHAATETKVSYLSRALAAVYTPNLFSKVNALVYRKLQLLFRSLLQILIIILLIAVPTALYFITTNMRYRAENVDEAGNVHEKEVKLGSENLAFINILSILYYTFSCGFFGLTPVSERLGRVRYLLKMNNVGTPIYYPTLLLPDALISLVLVVALYSICYLGQTHIYQSLSMEIVSLLGLSLFLWMLSFIAQSYVLSFVFDNKETAAKSLTTAMLLSYFVGTILYLSIGYFDSDTVKNVLRWIILMLFPGFSQIKNSGNCIYKASIDKEMFIDTNVKTFLCFVIFFVVAMILDHFNTRVKPGEPSPPVPVDRFCADPESIRREETAALGMSEGYPLQVQKVHKHFGQFPALTDVSIALRSSEIIGLLGQNGAGKSTLFNVISSYFSPTYGQVLYNGETVNSASMFYAQSGLCAQDDIIWPELSVNQHLKIYSKLLGVEPYAVEAWKKVMGLEGFGDLLSTNLSTGMKRKLCYIISMMANPKYKFLDEPSSGLDPLSRKLMRLLIKEQKKVYGGTCILSTHTMRDAEDLCDRVAILVNGRLSTIDTVQGLRNKIGGVHVWINRNIDSANPGADEMNAEQVMIEIFPESLENGRPILLDRTERQLIYFAWVKREDFITKFEKLVQYQQQGRVTNCGISQPNLEDTFLYLVRGQRPPAHVAPY